MLTEFADANATSESILSVNVFNVGVFCDTAVGGVVFCGGAGLKLAWHGAIVGCVAVVRQPIGIASTPNSPKQILLRMTSAVRGQHI